MFSHVKARSYLVISALVMIVACQSDRVSTVAGPGDAPLVRAGMSAEEKAAQDAAKDAKKAEHDRLMKQRDSVRAEYKRTREATRDEYERAKQEWNAYKKEWQEFKKDNKGAQVQLLRCEPQPFAGDAEVVGPDGGTLHIGPHSLVVPKGALDHEVLLVGSAPTSAKVEVDFGPHGLRFGSSALLTLSYDHCMRPDNFSYRIVYVDGNTVLEFRPSKDDKSVKSVAAPIDHFSGYMIAY
jgi:hypothetical protein